MFYLNKEQELTPELLFKMIGRFNLQVLPRLQVYKNYYDGKHNIIKKTYTDPNKPCCRAVVNYCANIVNHFTGYLASPGFISYVSDDNISEILEILRYNDYKTQDAEMLTNALIYGVAAELMYIDSDGQTRFKQIDPTTCFGICDDSLTGDLMYFVRMYPESEWDDSALINVDVYDDTSVKHYQTVGENGILQFKGEERHYFAQCPANILVLTDEKSIFDCILSLQDAYNETLSSEIDEYSQFADCYLTLTGVDAEAEDLAAMKENRVIILPEGANAAWLTKAPNDTQVENILKRIHDSIYRIAQCPDFSAENFVSGVSSGVAIRYRLTGCENRAGGIEAQMRKALQRRIEIICGIASLKLGEEVFRDIVIDFKRNVPEDMAQTISLINGLKGTVSDSTLLSQLDFIQDVDKELEALDEQKQRNMAIYSFAPTTDEGEDD